MGEYTKNLFSRNRKKPSSTILFDDDSGEPSNANSNGIDRLVSCAIVRDGEIHKGFRSHAELRRSLGDKDPYREGLYDLCGFMTSEGMFVDRREAMQIGIRSGQCVKMERDLLSSDINW